MIFNRTSFCVFCDDIRTEIGNKTSLMGLYSGDMIINGRPPQVIPKLCVAAWILSRADDVPDSIKIRLLGHPGNTEIFHIENHIDRDTLLANVRPDSTKISLHTEIPVINLLISQEGFLELMIDSGKGEERAGRLDVKFIPA